MPHKNEVFFNKRAITTEDVNSDVIDTGAANIAKGMRLEIDIEVNTPFVLASGAPTLTFRLQECDTEGGTYTDVLVTKAYLTAALGKGKLIRFGLPTPIKKFIRLQADVAVSTFSAGAVSAHLRNQMY